MKIRHYGPNVCPAGVADTKCLYCSDIHVIRWLDTIIAPYPRSDLVAVIWDCPTTGRTLAWRFTVTDVAPAEAHGAVVYGTYEWNGADQRMFELECAIRKGERA